MSALGQGTVTAGPAVNVYGILAFSGLAGMFSRQAIEKLAEVFDVLFQKTKQEVQERPLGDLAGKRVGGDGAEGEGSREAGQVERGAAEAGAVDEAAAGGGPDQPSAEAGEERRGGDPRE